MRTPRSPWWKASGLGLAAALAVALAAGDARATVAVELERPQLVDTADLVVRVNVVDHRSAWNGDNTAILTWTRLRVTEYLKGSGPAELVLRQIGGEAGGLAQRVSGDPRLADGADAVLFLRRGDGVVFLTAMAQSVFYVQSAPGGAAYVNRDLEGLTFARVSPTRPTELYAPPTVTAVETLDSLRAEVRRRATVSP